MSLGNLVTGNNLGPNFVQDAVLEEIRVNVGAGLVSDPVTGVISATATRSFALAGGALTGDGNNDGPLAVSNDRADAGWVSNGAGFTFTGAPDHVEINTHAVYLNDADAGTKQRIAPVLELRRNGAPIAFSITGYQRHTGGANDSSNAIVFTDLNPGANPVYEIFSQQGANQTDVEAIDNGQATFKAIL